MCEVGGGKKGRSLPLVVRLLFQIPYALTLFVLSKPIQECGENEGQLENLSRHNA